MLDKKFDNNLSKLRRIVNNEYWPFFGKKKSSRAIVKRRNKIGKTYKKLRNKFLSAI